MMMVCVLDGSFLKIKTNGVTVEELMPNGKRWAPYKLWQADLYICERCGYEVVAGFGQRPIAEHYQADYPQLVERHQPFVRAK